MVVQVGGFTSSRVLSVGLTPQSVSVSQANFQIQPNLALADYNVSLTVGTPTTTGPLVSVK